MEPKSVSENRVVLSELACNILTEFNISAFNEFVKVAGPLDTLDLMRPYKQKNMLILLVETRRQMNLKGNGPDQIAIPFFIAHSSLGKPEDAELEIREKGVIGTCHDCIFKNATPEFCVVMSREAGDAVCEALNPPYEMLWTHQLTNGDPFCRYIVKKKTEPYNNPEDLGKVIATLPKVNLSKEQLLRFKGFILSRFWGATTEGFVDYCGPEKAMEILGANAHRIGIGAGTYLVQSGMIKERNATGAGQFIDLFEKGSERYGDVIRSSSNEFSKEIVNCPFKDQPRGICLQFESFFNGMCKAVNPDLEYKYSKMMTAGDHSCFWSVTKK
jgi:hypothetical protein